MSNVSRETLVGRADADVSPIVFAILRLHGVASETKEGVMTNRFDPQQCRVALLVGGKSGEREVSLASGEGAQKALLEAGFPVTVLDPAEKEDLKKLIDGPFDVAFICLHGKYGEDGALQGLLELLEIPYIGSGIWASALSIDKAKAKLFYKMADIPTPPSVVLSRGDDVVVRDIMNAVGDHCVVKAAKEGSTIGVFIVEGEHDIAEAVEKAFEYDSEVVVEKFVKGMELTVAVIGNEDPEAFPIIEIVPSSGFYDYEAKYEPGGSQHICPARLSDKDTALIMDYARRAHKVLGCEGVSRSDFILDDQGISWVLETNTIPGMTSTSLLPDAARVAGMSFSELCTKLVELALEEK